MLGFIKISNRKTKLLAPAVKYLAPCSRVQPYDAGATAAVSHTRIPYTNLSGKAITNLEVFYVNFTYTAVLEWNGTAPLSVRAAVEYPVGTMTPLYDASGNRDIAITAGGIGDALKASGLNIPAGAIYYIRTRCLTTGGDSFMLAQYENGTPFEGGSIQAYRSTTNDGNDYTTSGSQPTSAGLKGYGPAAVCSRETGNKPRSFAIVGDSISRGYPAGSFAEAGLLGAGYGFLNFANSGAKLTDNTSFAKRRSLMQAMGITDVIMNYPTNDLKAGKTVAQCQSAYNTLWTNLKASGIQRIVQATCTPRTTIDINTPDASPVGAYTGGASSYRSQINAWFRSIVGQANKPDFVFELSDVVESGRDTGLWKDTTVTADLLHLSATGVSQTGAALTSFLQANGY